MLDSTLEKLYKAVTSIPGVTGMTSIDLSKDSVASTKKWKDAISFEDNNKNGKLNIAIMISNDAIVKNLVSEINLTLKFLLKKEKIKLPIINIYIRGVK